MHDIVLIKGDGIGPEITDSVTEILAAAKTDINWIPAQAGMEAFEKNGNPLPDETVELIEKHKVALKGPLTTPVGSGFRSINVALRQRFDLYSNIRPARTLPGVPTHFGSVDLVTFRENTQGMYIGQERWVDEDQTTAESIAIVTREASQRIIRAAFDYAVKRGRKRVSLIHKANILKYTTGLFLKVGQEVAREYPDIEFNDMIVDNTAMQMVMRPEIFDIIVTTNLFGDILSDLASGLVGGLGVTGSANMGEQHAIFEAVHGGENPQGPLSDAAGQERDHGGPGRRWQHAHFHRSGDPQHAIAAATTTVSGRGQPQRQAASERRQPQRNPYPSLTSCR